MPVEKLDAFLEVYAGHLSDVLNDDDKIYQWTARQTYIAVANMMNAAANLEIDSCPIEGFEKENVEKVLGLDTSKFQVALMLPFGYRINEQSEQLRLSFEDVVEFIK
jgi:nitroreductase